MRETIALEETMAREGMPDDLKIGWFGPSVCMAHMSDWIDALCAHVLYHDIIRPRDVHP